MAAYVSVQISGVAHLGPRLEICLHFRCLFKECKPSVPGSMFSDHDRKIGIRGICILREAHSSHQLIVWKPTVPEERDVVPPRSGAVSKTATERPSRVAVSAAVRPAAPEPRTTRSTSSTPESARCIKGSNRIASSFSSTARAIIRGKSLGGQIAFTLGSIRCTYTSN